MTPGESVNQWIAQLQVGDPAAAQKLWERYFKRMVGLARKKLHDNASRSADEEDVALSALYSFFRGAELNQFRHLLDEDSLWRLLATITVRKARQAAVHERRQKRGGNAVLDEAALATGGHSRGPGLDQVTDGKPTPEFAAQMAEEFKSLLESLPDAELRLIALCKMEGFTNEEIATSLDCVARTIERKLRVIRSFIWVLADD